MMTHILSFIKAVKENTFAEAVRMATICHSKKIQLNQIIIFIPSRMPVKGAHSVQTFRADYLYKSTTKIDRISQTKQAALGSSL